MLIQKFGGTSVADLRGFEACADIIASHAADDTVFVVLSAVKGVTDLLEAAIEAAESGGDATEALEAVIARHLSVLDDCERTHLEPAGLQYRTAR